MTTKFQVPHPPNEKRPVSVARVAVIGAIAFVVIMFVAIAATGLFGESQRVPMHAIEPQQRRAATEGAAPLPGVSSSAASTSTRLSAPVPRRGVRGDIPAQPPKTLRIGELEWQQSPPKTKMFFKAAGAYCKHLKLNGGGWRLPSREELVEFCTAARDDPNFSESGLIIKPLMPKHLYDIFDAGPIWSSTLTYETRTGLDGQEFQVHYRIPAFVVSCSIVDKPSVVIDSYDADDKEPARCVRKAPASKSARK
jgi:hypothetical protein